jgi:hypothetical protein
MTPEEIGISARRILGDSNKNHWDDERMLEAVNEAIQDVCKHSHAYRREFIIDLTDGISRYSLPDDFMQLMRLEYDEKSIDVLTRTQIDTGKFSTAPFVALKDNLELQVIEIHPTPSNMDDPLTSEDGTYPEPLTVEDIYGVVTDPVDDDGIEGGFDELLLVRDASEYGEIYGLSSPGQAVIPQDGDDLGVLDEITFDLYSGSDAYGVIQSTTDFEVIGYYGLLASLVVKTRSLRVFYSGIPPELRSMNAPIILHPLWKRSIIDYTVGVLLLDDNDAADKQRAERMFAKYDRELQKARKMTKKDYIGLNKNANVSTYRSI